MSSNNKKNKIGLTLGGGGARGFAHLGVYKALEEKSLKPDIISGVSAGAVMGAFIADGKSADEIFELLSERSFFTYSKFRFYKSGFARLEGLKKDLEEHISVSKLEDLKIPLVICLTNLSKGLVEYREKGDLVKLVLASSSIPVLFTPMEMEGDLFIDGGLFDNLPLKPIVDKCDKVIGVNISPIREERDLDSIIDVSARVFQLSTHVNILNRSNQFDILIEPEKLTKFSILDADGAKEMFEIGYEATIKADLDSLK